MGSIGEGGSSGGVAGSSSCLSAESIKVMGEGSGAPALGDEAARELAEDVSFKVRAVLQDALHFMHHARRQRCLPDDINHALRLRNIEVNLHILTIRLMHFIISYCFFFLLCISAAVWIRSKRFYAVPLRFGGRSRAALHGRERARSERNLI